MNTKICSSTRYCFGVPEDVQHEWIHILPYSLPSKCSVSLTTGQLRNLTQTIILQHETHKLKVWQSLPQVAKSQTKNSSVTGSVLCHKNDKWHKWVMRANNSTDNAHMQCIQSNQINYRNPLRWFTHFVPRTSVCELHALTGFVTCHVESHDCALLVLLWYNSSSDEDLHIKYIYTYIWLTVSYHSLVLAVHTSVVCCFVLQPTYTLSWRHCRKWIALHAGHIQPWM